ncbi:MAG: hypothetical protein EP330_15690 [Deltaproteobacteria bacterium]|nr:MAG: hypothetical protein EP330_15690 [Deltaproteobacteria bacterium]
MSTEEEPEDLVVRVFAWLLPALVAGSVVLAFHPGFAAPLLDPDLWWQLWAGEQMLDGQFPRENGLAWTAPHTPWVSHEPLVALVYGLVGLEGLWLVKGLLVSGVGLLLVALGWREESVWASVLAVLWALLLYRFGFSLRALTWGNFMLGACVAVLFRTEAPGRLPAATALVWLWAQIHGSFVLGVFMLLLVSWRWGLAALALTLLNPNGVGLWALVVGYGVGGGSEALVHAFVQEWHPLYAGGSQALFMAVAIAAAGVLLFTGEDHRPKLIWLVATLLAVKHQRYVDIVAVACLPFVADRLAELFPARRGASALPMAAVGFLAVWLFSPRAAPYAGWYPPELPEAVPAGARLYNDFRLGGYLGREGVAVFMDSRNDCYPPEVLSDGFAVERRVDGWRDILAKWAVDHVATAHPELQEGLAAEGWTVLGRWEADGEAPIELLAAP